MSEPDTPPKPAAANVEPSVVKVVQDTPAVFVDGVSQHTTAPGISKFYLYRNDANPKTPSLFTNVTVIQVIMPANGFVDMVAFFEHRLKVMIHRGDISQALIDERREYYSNMPIV